MYLIANSEYSFVSSSGVKEIAAFGGNVDGLVPSPVARRFQRPLPGRPTGCPRHRKSRLEGHGRSRLIDKLDDLVHNARRRCR